MDTAALDPRESGLNFSLRSVLLFLLIALSPMDDTFLQHTVLRGLGKSFSVFPLLALASISLMHWIASGRWRVSRKLAFVLVYMFLSSVYGIAVFGTELHGESLILKGIFAFISLGLTCFVVFGLDYTDQSSVRRGVYAAFALLILGVLFDPRNPFGLPPLTENSILHATPPDVRPRGLSSEPSMLSITALGLGLLAVHLGERKLTRVVLFVTTLCILVLSGSKGGVITLAFSGVIFFAWHSRSTKQRLIFIPATLLLTMVLVIYLIPLIFTDTVLQFATVATRVSMIICALQTLIHHPLGVGFSGFLPAISRYLPSSMSRLAHLISLPLDFNEVAAYVVSSENASTKTFLFDQIMRFGLPFILAFAAFCYSLLRELTSRRHLALFLSVLAIVIGVSTYVTCVGSYSCAIVLGVALQEVRNAKRTSCYA